MRSSRSELREKLLKLIRSEPGVTVEEVAERLGVSGYEAYKTVRELAREGLVELREDEGSYDPYRPGSTRSVYPAHSRTLLEPDREKVSEGTRVELVLTHPTPPMSPVSYISFIECLEEMVNEAGYVEGIVGYVDARVLSRACYYVLQRLKRRFSVRIACAEAWGDLASATSELRASGVEAEVRVKPDIVGKFHAKFLVANGLSYVGSHNFTEQALSVNLEVGVLLRDHGIASTLKKLFESVWGS